MPKLGKNCELKINGTLVTDISDIDFGKKPNYAKYETRGDAYPQQVSGTMEKTVTINCPEGGTTHGTLDSALEAGTPVTISLTEGLISGSFMVDDISGSEPIDGVATVKCSLTCVGTSSSSSSSSSTI